MYIHSDYSSDYSDWTADAGINLEPPKKTSVKKKKKKNASSSEEDGEKKKDSKKDRRKEKQDKDEALPKKKTPKEKRKVSGFLHINIVKVFVCTYIYVLYIITYFKSNHIDGFSGNNINKLYVAQI